MIVFPGSATRQFYYNNILRIQSLFNFIGLLERI